MVREAAQTEGWAQTKVPLRPKLPEPDVAHGGQVQQVDSDGIRMGVLWPFPPFVDPTHLSCERAGLFRGFPHGFGMSGVTVRPHLHCLTPCLFCQLPDMEGALGTMRCFQCPADCPLAGGSSDVPVKACPLCAQPLQLKRKKNGAGFFVGCKGFRGGCQYTVFLPNGEAKVCPRLTDKRSHSTKPFEALRPHRTTSCRPRSAPASPPCKVGGVSSRHLLLSPGGKGGATATRFISSEPP